MLSLRPGRRATIRRPPPSVRPKVMEKKAVAALLAGPQRSALQLAAGRLSALLSAIPTIAAFFVRTARPAKRFSTTIVAAISASVVKIAALRVSLPPFWQVVTRSPSCAVALVNR